MTSPLPEEYDPLTVAIAQEGEDFDIEHGGFADDPTEYQAPTLSWRDHGREAGLRGMAQRLLSSLPLAASGSPSARGWGAAGEHQRANCVKVTARGVSVWMHREVAVVFGHLMVDLDDHLKAMRKHDLAAKADDWGLAIRKVRGSKTVWSNHAWGLAADFNAIENPMTDRLVTTYDPTWVRNLLRTKYRGLIRWGGDYAGRKDAMHFEFMGTPADARILTASLRKRPAPPAPNRSHQHAKPLLQPGANHPAVKDVQGHLNAAYRPYHRTIHPLPTDGVWGDRTTIRYRDWQKRTGLRVTGLVTGPDWGRLHQVTKSVRYDQYGTRF